MPRDAPHGWVWGRSRAPPAPPPSWAPRWAPPGRPTPSRARAAAPPFPGPETPPKRGVRRLRADLEAELARRPRVSGPGVAPGQVAVTQRLARLLDAAEQESKRLKDEYVSVEHLIIALLAEGQQSAAGRQLAAAGLTRDGFFQALTGVRGSPRGTSGPPPSPPEAPAEDGGGPGAGAGGGAAGPGPGPGGRAPPRARWTRGTCSSRCSPAVSCT